MIVFLISNWIILWLGLSKFLLKMNRREGKRFDVFSARRNLTQTFATFDAPNSSPQVLQFYSVQQKSANDQVEPMEVDDYPEPMEIDWSEENCLFRRLEQIWKRKFKSNILIV